MTGSIVLVGAGPGDPDLITLRGEAALAAADLVVADGAALPLASALASRAELVEATDVATVADRIGRGLRAGHAVVRLYAGDPWMHDGFGAERRALVAAGLAVEVVPGLVTEWAVAGLAGVPVHHRPRSVVVTTGPVEAFEGRPDPARTLVTQAPDLGLAVAALVARGHGRLPAAALPTCSAPLLLGSPGMGAVRSVTVQDLAEGRATGPGVLVVGAVAG